MENVTIGQMVVFENHNGYTNQTVRVVGVIHSVYVTKMRDGSDGEYTAIVGLGNGSPNEPCRVELVKNLFKPTEAEIAKFHHENAECEAMLARGHKLMKTLDECEAAAEREDGGMK